MLNIINLAELAAKIRSEIDALAGKDEGSLGCSSNRVDLWRVLEPECAAKADRRHPTCPGDVANTAVLVILQSEELVPGMVAAPSIWLSKQINFSPGNVPTHEANHEA